MLAQFEVYIRPYRNADYFAWVAIGQEFRVKSRREAHEYAERNGYVVCRYFRIIIRGE